MVLVSKNCWNIGTKLLVDSINVIEILWGRWDWDTSNTKKKLSRYFNFGWDKLGSVYSVSADRYIFSSLKCYYKSRFHCNETSLPDQSKKAYGQNWTFSNNSGQAFIDAMNILENLFFPVTLTLIFCSYFGMNEFNKRRTDFVTNQFNSEKQIKCFCTGKSLLFSPPKTHLQSSSKWNNRSLDWVKDRMGSI